MILFHIRDEICWLLLYKNMTAVLIMSSLLTCSCDVGLYHVAEVILHTQFRYISTICETRAKNCELMYTW